MTIKVTKSQITPNLWLHITAGRYDRENNVKT